MLTATAGSFVWMPREVPHTFRVDSPSARMLTNLCAGGFDEFFSAIGRPAEELTLPPPPEAPPDQEVMVAHAHAYGVEFVGPPMTGVPAGEGRVARYRSRASSRPDAHTSAMPVPMQTPTTTSLSQWTARYVRLTAIRPANAAAAPIEINRRGEACMNTTTTPNAVTAPAIA